MVPNQKIIHLFEESYIPWCSLLNLYLEVAKTWWQDWSFWGGERAVVRDGCGGAVVRRGKIEQIQKTCTKPFMLGSLAGKMSMHNVRLGESYSPPCQAILATKSITITASSSIYILLISLSSLLDQINHRRTLPEPWLC